jgi:putative Ca2+/H+ antiporter (TMEM165/GDT1 family)
VILFSELGDNTFFLALIMSMKHSRVSVYSGAMLANLFMTALSALLGNILTATVLSKRIASRLAAILFAFYGARMCLEAWRMSSDKAASEMDEAKERLEASEAAEKRKGDEEESFWTSCCCCCFSAVFVQAFALTFLQEWGDRSQVATIVLAAKEQIVAVVMGGTLGHAVCTGLAVLGGRWIAKRISVKAVTFLGGLVFIFFAFTARILESE